MQIYVTKLYFSIHAKSKKFWLVTCGSLLFVLAIVIGLSWTSIINALIRQEFKLKKGSTSYKYWVDVPVPMYVKYKMFNWTNPHNMHKRNYKPIVVEMGPYVFLEKHVRVNVSFHPENDTVSFDQIRTWHFIPEMSNGTLNDNVTNVNVIAATVAFTLQNSFQMVKFGASQLMNLLNVQIAVTKTVRELLYDGYDDPILKTINKMPWAPKTPFNKFGWFVGQNESWSANGHFEMRTGLKDITQMGEVTKWNYANETKFYRDECSRVKGTTGELWPMNMNATGDISIFVADLCRSITLKYEREQLLYGLKGSRWIGDDRVFDNGRRYPQNGCLATNKTSPKLWSGVQDLSDCRFGAPVFASYPHFYLADKSYVKAIRGMNPKKSEHEFSLTLEPTTGIPLHANARVQINTLIQPIKGYKQYEKVPRRMMIPALYFSSDVQITEKLAEELKVAIELPTIGPYVAIALLTLSLILLLSGGTFSWQKSWTPDKHLIVSKSLKSQLSIK